MNNEAIFQEIESELIACLPPQSVMYVVAHVMYEATFPIELRIELAYRLAAYAGLENVDLEPVHKAAAIGARLQTDQGEVGDFAEGLRKFVGACGGDEHAAVARDFMRALPIVVQRARSRAPH